MSGIVAVISRDPDVLGRGPAMLARLRHLPRYQIATLAVDGAWLGVCGWPAGIAAAGGRGDAGEASVVVCGEFLNAAELRRELRLPHAANAAEIALAAYRRWDDDLFAHLDGVYALALHDAASRWTLAGVDPNTVAVLQAVEIAGDVLVASEAKAFLCDPRFQPRLDELTCATLLALEAMIDGRSLFAGVEGLANGRHFEAHGGSIATVRHWDPREVAGAPCAASRISIISRRPWASSAGPCSPATTSCCRSPAGSTRAFSAPPRRPLPTRSRSPSAPRSIPTCAAPRRWPVPAACGTWSSGSKTTTSRATATGRSG